MNELLILFLAVLTIPALYIAVLVASTAYFKAKYAYHSRLYHELSKGE